MDPVLANTLVIAFFGSLPATIAAIAALFAALRNGKKTDKISTKTDEIHDMTNGNLTRAKDDLASEKVESGRLREELIRYPRERRSIAPADLLQAVPHPDIAARLERLEKQLAAMEKEQAAP